MTRMAELRSGGFAGSSRVGGLGTSCARHDRRAESCPEADLRDFGGSLKLFDRRRIEEYDLSPARGHHARVTSEEEDEGFDFEETLRAIHVDLAALNEEAVELAAQFARNLEELGA